MELPPDSGRREESTYKFFDIVEEWEIDLWKAHMKHYFPCDEGAFSPGKSSPPTLLLGDMDLNPDCRYPDQIMKPGAPRKEFMPKLIRFVLCGKIDIVKKLLDKGMGVNLCSALDETSIGAAVENLHVDSSPTSWDVEMFDLPAKPVHKEKTLNKRTAMRKLLPITSATGTGRPEEVERWLKMGADSNRRGPDDQNPSVYLHLLPYDGSKLKRWFGRFVFNAYHAQVFGPFVWIYRWVFRVWTETADSCNVEIAKRPFVQ